MTAYRWSFAVYFKILSHNKINNNEGEGAGVKGEKGKSLNGEDRARKTEV